MLKRTLMGLVAAVAVAVATAQTAEANIAPDARFVRWKNDDGTLNCYPGCDAYKPCC